MMAEKLVNSPSVMENKLQMEKLKHEKYFPFLQDIQTKFQVSLHLICGMFNSQRYPDISIWVIMRTIWTCYDVFNYRTFSQIIRHNNTIWLLDTARGIARLHLLHKTCWVDSRLGSLSEQYTVDIVPTRIMQLLE